MVAFIQGEVADRTEGSLIIDHNGIGYNIFVPNSVVEELRVGDEVRIYTHMAVREDAITLYGFLNREDLKVFRQLLTVSGIGPKGALAVLSAMTAADLKFAVLADDVRSISAVPGLGKKTAQKLILELKDKLNLDEALESGLGEKENAAVQEHEGGNVQSEAVMALTALGYSGAQAMKAVRAVLEEEKGLGVEDVLKKALKKM